jgi:hypothetical protein
MAPYEGQSVTTSRWNFLAVLLMVTTVFLAGRAALPLSQVRWQLSGDEKLAFDGAHGVLSARSPRQFIERGADGGDQRYGRLFFTTSALASAVPAYFWGERGLILGTRFFQIFVLLAAVGLLAWQLFPAGPWRLLGLSCLLAAAPSEYYLSMPKPEPQQALCLVIFAGLAAWNGWKFGWHWFWAGMAFGLKISALPALAVFGVAGLLHGRTQGLFKASLAFLMGWVFVVPVLLAGPQGWHSWAAATILNTGNGSDDSRTTWHDWVSWIGPNSAPLPWMAWAVAVLAAVIWAAWLMDEDRGIGTRWRSAFWLGLAGLLWAGVLMLNVKRVWGFYLWIPLLFLHAWAVAAAVWGWKKGRSLRAMAAVLTVLLVVNALSTEWPRLVAGLDVQAKREQDPEYLLELQDRVALQDYMDALPRRPSPWVVCMEVFFEPKIDPRIQYHKFWGYFIDWDLKPDVIVMIPSTMSRESIPPTNVDYQLMHEQMDLRARHTVGVHGTCGLAPCYRQEKLGRLFLLRRTGDKA